MGIHSPETNSVEQMTKLGSHLQEETLDYDIFLHNVTADYFASGGKDGKKKSSLIVPIQRRLGCTRSKVKKSGRTSEENSHAIS